MRLEYFKGEINMTTGMITNNINRHIIDGIMCANIKRQEKNLLNGRMSKCNSVKMLVFPQDYIKDGRPIRSIKSC